MAVGVGTLAAMLFTWHIRTHLWIAWTSSIPLWLLLIGEAHSACPTSSQFKIARNCATTTQFKWQLRQSSTNYRLWTDHHRCGDTLLVVHVGSWEPI
jgi:hypothetical protein